MIKNKTKNKFTNILYIDEFHLLAVSFRNSQATLTSIK